MAVMLSHQNGITERQTFFRLDHCFRAFDVLITYDYSAKLSKSFLLLIVKTAGTILMRKKVEILHSNMSRYLIFTFLYESWPF